MHYCVLQISGERIRTFSTLYKKKKYIEVALISHCIMLDGNCKQLWDVFAQFETDMISKYLRDNNIMSKVISILKSPMYLYL